MCVWFLALVSRYSADVFPEVCKSSLEVCVVFMKLRSCIIHRCSGESSACFSFTPKGFPSSHNALLCGDVRFEKRESVKLCLLKHDLRDLTLTSPVHVLPFGPKEAGSGETFSSRHQRAAGGDDRNPILWRVQPRELKSHRNTCRNAAENDFWSWIIDEEPVKIMISVFSDSSQTMNI